MTDPNNATQVVDEANDLQLIEVEVKQELIKNNVTDKVLADLRVRFKDLKIANIEDKQGFKIVSDARKECKRLRVLAKTICEKGREKHIAIQKAWVAKQKEVTSIIDEIEAPLKTQEDWFENEQQRIKEEKAQKERERIQGRVNKLFELGMAFNGQQYSIGDVIVNTLEVTDMPDLSFDKILAAANVEADKERLKKQAEDIRIREQAAENQRLKDEADQMRAEMALQKQKAIDDQLAKDKIIADEMAKIKADNDHLLQQAENDKNIAQKRIYDGRVAQLRTMGLQSTPTGMIWSVDESRDGQFVREDDIQSMADDAFFERTEYIKQFQATEQAEWDKVLAKRRKDEEKAEIERLAKIKAMQPDKDALLEFAKHLENELPYPAMHDDITIGILAVTQQGIGELVKYLRLNTQKLN